MDLAGVREARRTIRVRVGSSGALGLAVMAAALLVSAADAWAEDYRVTARPWPPFAGSVTRAPDQDTYAEGTEVTLEASAGAGWRFDHWAGEGFDTSSGATATFNVTGTTWAVAYFVRLQGWPESSLWSWGRNQYGQLGNGGYETPQKSPGHVVNSDGMAAAATYSFFTMAIHADGTVWAWGSNYCGELGDGTEENSAVPVQVAGIEHVVDVAGGSGHTVVLRADGTVWCWGENSQGQLGDGTTTRRHAPVQVTGLSDVVSVSAGWGATMALRADGTVYAWGDNQFGQLGNGTTAYFQATPVAVSSMDDAVAITASGTTAFAIRQDGSLWGWGRNQRGQLGDGTEEERHLPVEVNALAGVVACASHDEHTHALLADRTAWAWGLGREGRLGTGNDESTLTPVPMLGLPVATAISPTHAIADGGRLWGWGRNGAGQIGDGSRRTQLSPVMVLGMDAVLSVDEGSGHTVALVAPRWQVTTHADPSGGGTVAVEPDRQWFQHQESVTLTARAGPDYTFLRWEGLEGLDLTGDPPGPGPGNVAEVSFDATRDVTATAVFEKTHYLLGFTQWPREGGTTTAAPQQAAYAPGEQVTIEA